MSNQEPSKARDTALQGALSQIERQFGKGSVMRMGDPGAQVKCEAIPTGALSLDLALGIGGIPRGRIVEVFGPESSGKTTLIYHIIAEAQKLGGVCAFIDAEHAMDPLYAQRIGVNIDELLVSQPDYGEQALEIADMLVRSGAVDVVAVDSVAALTPRSELEGQMGDQTVGLQARMMSQAMRKLAGNLNRTQTLCIFTNQIREKVGVMFGSPETQPGGRALKFYASQRLDIRRIETLKDGTEAVGNRVRVKVVKNKVAAPFRQAEFDIEFGQGISSSGCILDLGIEHSIVSKSGSFFSYGDERLGQGRTNAKGYLDTHPEVAKEIEGKVYEVLGVNQDLVTPIEGDPKKAAALVGAARRQHGQRRGAGSHRPRNPAGRVLRRHGGLARRRPPGHPRRRVPRRRSPAHHLCARPRRPRPAAAASDAASSRGPAPPASARPLRPAPPARPPRTAFAGPADGAQLALDASAPESLGALAAEPPGATALQLREEAFNTAWRFLARRERTEAEVRARLERNDVEAPLIDEVLDELMSGGYVDDAGYATRFAEDRRNLDGWGADRIERRLRELGVERHHIAAALAAGDHDELAAATRAPRAPLPRSRPTPRGTSRRRSGSSSARGSISNSRTTRSAATRPPPSSADHLAPIAWGDRTDVAARPVARCVRPPAVLRSAAATDRVRADPPETSSK